MRGSAGARAAILLVVGWSLLTAAWTIGNPPFAAPDEVDHYVRTVGVAAGALVGRAAPEAAGGVTPDQIAWTGQATRSVPVPSGLAAGADCYVKDRRRSAACIEEVRPANLARQTTPVGTYQPLPYLLPAATVQVGGTPQAAVRWARLPGALTALGLLALAVALLRDTRGDPRALLGLLVATTPMVIFCAASLTGSGLEIAAGIAFGAALLRLTRPGPSPPWAWAAAGGAGAVLALSRSTGPTWVLLMLLLALALVGPGGARARLRGGGPPAAIAAAAIAVGIGVNRAWEAAYGPEVSLGLKAIGLGIERGIEQWWRASTELVGAFGYLEYRLPVWVPLAWLAVFLALAVLAFRAGGKRERRVLATASAVGVVLPLVLYVLIIRRTGFGLQGRHVLPLLVALPLLAGELVYRARAPLRSWMFRAATMTLAAVHLVAFWLNARRSSVGVDGPLFFLRAPEWEPPPGWGPVLALALAGAVAVASVGWTRAAR